MSTNLPGLPSMSSSLHNPFPLSLRGCSPTHSYLSLLLSHITGALSFYRIKPIVSHWGKTRQSSGTYVVGRLDQPFGLLPTSSMRIPDFTPVFGCKYLHLFQSYVDRASQRRAMPSSILKAQHGISNSVMVWCLPVGWIPSRAGQWMPFHCNSFRHDQFWVKIFKDGQVSPCLKWRPCLSNGGFLFRFHLPTVGLFY